MLSIQLCLVWLRLKYNIYCKGGKYSKVSVLRRCGNGRLLCSVSVWLIPECCGKNPSVIPRDLPDLPFAMIYVNTGRIVLDSLLRPAILCVITAFAVLWIQTALPSQSNPAPRPKNLSSHPSIFHFPISMPLLFLFIQTHYHVPDSKTISSDMIGPFLLFQRTRGICKSWCAGFL